MIAQAELKELFNYDADIGVFTNKIDRGRVKAGDVSGTLNTGYIRIRIYVDRYLAHRLAWLWVYGEFPSGDLDHINHDRLDNRIKNLRLADKVINGKNMSLGKRNSSGIMGVSWNNKEKRWKAQISINKKRVYLGGFDDFFECACVRKSAENKYDYHENHGLRSSIRIF